MNDTNGTIAALVEPTVSSQTQRFFVTLAIFTISLTGLIGNLSVFMFATTLKTLQNSFGRLSASQSFAEAVLCGVFLFFYCPMVLLDIPTFKRVSAQVGLILLFCYDVCIFSHLFIAFNRLCAISFPIEYNSFFNMRNTRILIALAYAIPCFTSIYMHLANNCNLPYVDFGWYFGVNTSADCDVIRFYVDFCKDFGVVALIAIVDVGTIVMIKVTAPGMKLLSANCAQSQKKRQREITFVKQALIQGAVFATELVFFFIISGMQSQPVAIFLCTTVAWSLVHTIDPLVLILLNREFRNMLMKNPLTKRTTRVTYSITQAIDNTSSHTHN
ncbi:7TM GPCR serpentine receptor class x (Srx) domain-containing protein [Caenorhabditis elegans]|uniref:7TM GPCR serpentine receptor class x (Srx) domain-containing protein n=1 Tax=Caenorhabditis elegans TaxID=6239 RepID=O61881_CAEEL|nr:7TM GPCR serpentine receptor class x (Srx) domain-containing protein [Caenorhabditis elegans]CCD72121.1 7TM GPCR serpentine receptor class x (Srx) domain-containing protein [Caenorhabditis elegans]|eukprot:NP_504021.1 Serpentine Receptor, class X [Caenorhabditis elegans]